MDYNQSINELKEKLNVSNHQEKIQILTLMPQSWSIKKTWEEFHVSERMAKAARKLKIEKGRQAQPKNKRGKKLPENVKQKVMEIFEDQEFS